MLFNALIVVFISTYAVIAAYGHALLVMAIWPDLFGGQPGPSLASSDHTPATEDFLPLSGAAGGINQPG